MPGAAETSRTLQGAFLSVIFAAGAAVSAAPPAEAAAFQPAAATAITAAAPLLLPAWGRRCNWRETTLGGDPRYEPCVHRDGTPPYHLLMPPSIAPRCWTNRWGDVHCPYVRLRKLFRPARPYYDTPGSSAWK